MVSYLLRGAVLVALLSGCWVALVRYARFVDDWAREYRYYPSEPQSALEAGIEGFFVGGIVGTFLGALAGAGVGGIVQALPTARKAR
jgi:hypothetical protein